MLKKLIEKIKRNKKKSIIIFSIVIIVLLLFTVTAAFAGKTYLDNTKSPESTYSNDTQSVTLENKESIIYKNTIQVELQGQCSLDGSQPDYEEFLQDKCRLVNVKKDEVIKEFDDCTDWDNGRLNTNEPCVSVYSTLELGQKKVGFPYLKLSGGEGSSGFLYIFSLEDLNSMKMIEGYIVEFGFNGTCTYSSDSDFCSQLDKVDSQYCKLEEFYPTSCFKNYEKLNSSTKKIIDENYEWYKANKKY